MTIGDLCAIEGVMRPREEVCQISGLFNSALFVGKRRVMWGKGWVLSRLRTRTRSPTRAGKSRFKPHKSGYEGGGNRNEHTLEPPRRGGRSRRVDGGGL